MILNPWWEIPTSIVAEGIGSLVLNNPAAARRKGYVVQNGRYRQRPGPGNALGQMKLVMPNPYSVYLHDTPNKNLFSEPVRTFSHGCIRVGGAIDLDKTLLEGVVTPEQIDEILASRETTRLSLAKAIPIYIAYFTAEGADDGSIRYFPDVYKRDDLKLAQSEPRMDCAA
ncbi:L,D-transpeptidase family protein [Sphingopyxis sp. BSNA05]|uniref:L,D-transpeptidase family protein n=1 Tax=Sphingopyxis sp. BSNA05 TaxID=1236614 RepID=UPI001563205F